MMKVLEYRVKINLIHFIWECLGWLDEIHVAFWWLLIWEQVLVDNLGSPAIREIIPKIQ
jgi:hypothetical protein